MLLLNLLFVLLGLGYAARYASYEHFGVTVLTVNMIDNQITMESLVYGLVNGFIFATVCIWFCCIFMLITADKVVYMFGRISPKLSLFLSILLRTVPRIKTRAKRIEISREGIGKGIVQGNQYDKAKKKHIFQPAQSPCEAVFSDFRNRQLMNKLLKHAERAKPAAYRSPENQPV